jgi:hypothetical protein
MSRHPFVFADLRGLVGDDSRLTDNSVAGYRIRDGSGRWVAATPSEDRKFLEAEDGQRKRAKRKYYASTWGAEGRCVAADRLPFSAEPSGEAGRIWAVRTEKPGRWALARLGADGGLRQMRGLGKDSTAGSIEVPRFGEYGEDYGELLFEGDPETEKRAGAPNTLLARHPAVEGEWFPAHRDNNRWWFDCGKAGKEQVRDASVGTIDAMGESWKNVA